MDNDNKAAGHSNLIIEACSNPSAFVRLYRSHYEEVFRYCVHRLFERTAAEDVTSDVFLKVVENIHSFRGNERQFRNWLYRIATNAVNNYLRRTARRNRLLKVTREQVDSRIADCGESVEKLTLLFERSCICFEAAVPNYHHTAFF